MFGYIQAATWAITSIGIETSPDNIQTVAWLWLVVQNVMEARLFDALAMGLELTDIRPPDNHHGHEAAQLPG